MSHRFKRYTAAIIATTVLALSPILFNIVVDAFNHNQLVDLELDKQEISVKAHYPLYKMIEYPRIKAPVVVLGDSRARALQDKYWQELGRDDVYNFAYGGATVFEIYDTFKYLTETVELDTLIVSLPMRSMDTRFKGAMNRVPEAIRIANNPFSYYSNWFVAKTGWTLLEARYPALETVASSLSLNPVSAAKAAASLNASALSLDELLDPNLCEDCSFPKSKNTAPKPLVVFRSGASLGSWADYWPEITLKRDLPKLFAKQVGTNGAADWRVFKQSDLLWEMTEEIAAWCKENEVRLIFIIPPTVTEMQRRINDFGLKVENHKFRERLSALAPVVDFDFDGPFARDLENFTDAYHFSSRPARKIVGELLMLFDDDPERLARARKRRDILACPAQSEDITQSHSEGMVEMTEGTSCRVWRKL